MSSALCLAIGNFDGLHLGHRKVLQRTIEIATQHQLKPAVLSFYPHPISFLLDEKPFKYLMPLEDRIDLFKKLGMDEIIIKTFDLAFAQLSPEDFIRSITSSHKILHIITGEDFRFGNKRTGDIQTLEALGTVYHFGFTPVANLTCDGHRISSSYIKDMLKVGLVGIAARLLGNCCRIKGIVQKGAGIASTLLNIPTANLLLQDGLQYPTNGVYLSKALLPNGVVCYGVANLGCRPTLCRSRDLLLEIHLFDTCVELYNQEITVELLQMIRPERFFESIEALKQQIRMDLENAAYALAQIY